uniref:Uncharacterized protein n=1 Tax=Moschus moschiferus TaxID=68415 RepID=A0A8C6DK58_MOSMO
MVLLHVKRGDESQFLLQAPGSSELEDLTAQVARVYNARLKAERLCSEMKEFAERGVFLPPNMQGLTDEQIEELKLKDEWGEKCIPSGASRCHDDSLSHGVATVRSPSGWNLKMKICRGLRQDSTSPKSQRHTVVGSQGPETHQEAFRLCKEE